MRQTERGLSDGGFEPASAVACFLTSSHRIDIKQDKRKGNFRQF